MKITIHVPNLTKGITMFVVLDDPKNHCFQLKDYAIPMIDLKNGAEFIIEKDGIKSMADRIRFFKTYWNGMNLTAMIRRGLCGYALDVEYVDYDGKKHPYADYHYKDERGAERGLKTRFRGAEWVETT